MLATPLLVELTEAFGGLPKGARAMAVGGHAMVELSKDGRQVAGCWLLCMTENGDLVWVALRYLKAVRDEGVLVAHAGTPPGPGGEG